MLSVKRVFFDAVNFGVGVGHDGAHINSGNTNVVCAGSGACGVHGRLDHDYTKSSNVVVKHDQCKCYSTSTISAASDDIKRCMDGSGCGASHVSGCVAGCCFDDWSVHQYNAVVVLPESIRCADICQQVKRKIPLTDIHSLPTLEHIYSDNPLLYAFGQLNEVEYASGAQFQNTCIDPFWNDTFSIMRKFVRYYFEDEQMLYVNNEHVMTRCMDADTDIAVPCSIVLRLDYSSKAFDSCGRLDSRPFDVTAKLKLAKRKFNFVDGTYKLTAAIEANASHITTDISHLRVYSKCRLIYYWYVNVGGRRYRVAFREDIKNYEQRPGQLQKEHARIPYFGTYEFNVECEETVSPVEFVTVYDLLFKYYKTQHVVQGGVVMPYNHHVKCGNVADLTEYQRQLFATMTFRLSNPDVGAAAAIPKEMIQMHSFVKQLAIEMFRMHDQSAHGDLKMDIHDEDITDAEISDGADNDDDNDSISFFEDGEYCNYFETDTCDTVDSVAVVSANNSYDSHERKHQQQQQQHPQIAITVETVNRVDDDDDDGKINAEVFVNRRAATLSPQLLFPGFDGRHGYSNLAVEHSDAATLNASRTCRVRRNSAANDGISVQESDVDVSLE